VIDDLRVDLAGAVALAAWTPGQPERLVAVRFGLDGDRPAPIDRELDS
jgi:hypothetical protein